MDKKEKNTVEDIIKSELKNNYNYETIEVLSFLYLLKIYGSKIGPEKCNILDYDTYQILGSYQNFNLIVLCIQNELNIDIDNEKINSLYNTLRSYMIIDKLSDEKLIHYYGGRINITRTGIMLLKNFYDIDDEADKQPLIPEWINFTKSWYD